jgi:transketolase
VPGLMVIRPADANETVQAWRIAIECMDNPVVLILTRQKLPVLDLNKYPAITDGVKRGGYIIAESDSKTIPDVILIATGSELHLALSSIDQLAKEDLKVRIVSFPCWTLFKSQPLSYQNQILPKEIPQLFIEAGTTLGWNSYIGIDEQFIGVDKYGASAPGEVVMREYGFTVENICEKVRVLLQNERQK